MKKRIILIVSIVVILGALTLILLNTVLKKPKQLSVPSDVAINREANTLTWSAVDNAAGYIVDIDGETRETTETSYSLSSLTVYKTYALKV
jgi:hypothetical protein